MDEGETAVTLETTVFRAYLAMVSDPEIHPGNK